MSVHEVAATGFDAEAEAYERARPSYPPDAVAWLVEALGIARGRTVADVAAGTGKFTRLLVPSGADVRRGGTGRRHARVPARHLPRRARVVSGAAEALPFADGSLDAITVAQAFHWFDAHAALREFHRVLRPGGRVGLDLERARSIGAVGRRDVVDHGRGREARHRRATTTQWRAASATSRGSRRVTEAIFYHEQLLTHDEAVDRMRSVSHIAVLPPAEQESVLARRARRARHRPRDRRAGASGDAVPRRRVLGPATVIRRR